MQSVFRRCKVERLLHDSRQLGYALVGCIFAVDQVALSVNSLYVNSYSGNSLSAKDYVFAGSP